MDMITTLRNMQSHILVELADVDERITDIEYELDGAAIDEYESTDRYFFLLTDLEDAKAAQEVWVVKLNIVSTKLAVKLVEAANRRPSRQEQADAAADARDDRNAMARRLMMQSVHDQGDGSDPFGPIFDITTGALVELNGVVLPLDVMQVQS